MHTIHHQPRNRTQARTAPPTAQPDGSPDWRTRAVAIYRQVEQEELMTLPAVLATRIRDLTGRAVALPSIWVDREARTATVAVDGVLFRLRQHNLVLLRPCATCRSGYVESAPVEHRSDLGRALLAWEAACDDASEEDDEDWSHSW